MATCHMCGVELDQPDRPATKDCGGDCMRCVALCLDEDCMGVMHDLYPEDPRWSMDR